MATYNPIGVHIRKQIAEGAKTKAQDWAKRLPAHIESPENLAAIGQSFGRMIATEGWERLEEHILALINPIGVIRSDDEVSRVYSRALVDILEYVYGTVDFAQRFAQPELDKTEPEPIE